MQDEEIKTYPYRFVRKRICGDGSLFEETADYTIDAVDLNSGETVPYTFRSYRYGGSIYITDIFPSTWDNDPQCFKRVISREGVTVNMRRISVTCLVLFAKHYIGNHADAVMVVSGSYERGEKECGPSRKLRLYYAFFGPLVERLDLRVVNMPEMNAFMLTGKRSGITDRQIRESYIEFKNVKRGQNGST